LKHVYTAITTCATPDLLFKHPDAALETYKRRQMKHLKYASETLAKKTPEKHLKTIVEHTQHQDKTLATYV
jgi:hypothetical protein